MYKQLKRREVDDVEADREVEVIFAKTVSDNESNTTAATAVFSQIAFDQPSTSKAGPSGVHKFRAPSMEESTAVIYRNFNTTVPSEWGLRPETVVLPKIEEVDETPEPVQAGCFTWFTNLFKCSSRK